MKYILTTFTLLVHTAVVFCQQVSRYPDRSHDYWVRKDIVGHYTKKQAIEKTKYPFESIVFGSTDSTIYMTTWGTEYIWPVGKIDNIETTVKLTIGELSDTLYTGNDFSLKLGRDSLVLNITDKNHKIDTLIFAKPNPYLTQNSRDEVLFSYQLSGRYICSYNPSLQKDTIYLTLDGKTSGLDSISNWKLGHLTGITNPRSSQARGVVTLTGTTVKQYYAIFNRIDKNWRFYNYNRDKRSIYHLRKEPDMVLKLIE